MPQKVFIRVNQLWVNDGQIEVLTFYNRKGELIWDTNPSADPTISTVEAITQNGTENPGT